MYEKTDKVIDYLNEQLIRLFNKAKRLLKTDELSNIVTYSKELYEEIRSLSKEAYFQLASNIVKDIDSTLEFFITEEMIDEILSTPNPVTKYKFYDELDRKRERLVESLLASKNKQEEIITARNLLSRQLSQYAIEVSDYANLWGMEQIGVKKVKWNTQEDEKTCKECKALDGKVFDINKAPDKTHYGCRCYYTMVKE